MDVEIPGRAAMRLEFFKVEDSKDSLEENIPYPETCTCSAPEGRLLLEIDCGSVSLVHADCGKQYLDPMGDLMESACLGSLAVTGRWSECTCVTSHPDFSRCGCTKYLELTVNRRGER